MKLRHSGEATMAGNSAGHASSLHVLSWHLPYNWGENRKKNLSWKVPVGYDSVCQHDHLLTGSHDKFVASGLPWDAREDVCQHSVSVDICQGVPEQLTLSVSWLKLWCGQQRMQLPNPQEFGSNAETIGLTPAVSWHGHEWWTSRWDTCNPP